MSFSLYKGGSSSTVPMERYIAAGAIAKGMPVYLTAGASAAELGKVTQLAGASNASETLYGIAAHAAAITEEVLIIPVTSSQIWIADAVANTNVSNVAADNYLTATTLTVTVGASTLNGRKCEIIGQLGATGDKKYLVRLGNFSTAYAMPSTATVIAFSLDKSATSFSAAAVALAVAPYAMNIDDVIVRCTGASTNGTVKVMKDTTEICTAIVCAADGVIAHASAGATAAKKALWVLAAGDTINIQAAGDTATSTYAVVTLIGHRV
jgi:hypothetical protein